MNILNECKTISIGELSERRLFKNGKTIILEWKDSSYDLDPDIENKIVLALKSTSRLDIGYFVSSKELKRIAYSISLIPSQNCIKGHRYYFQCPLLKDNGVPCRRISSKLYLPDGQTYFGCRICHNIGYPTQLVNQKHSQYSEIKRIILERRIDQLESKIAHKTYRGRKTKNQMRLEELYKVANSFPSIIYGFSR